MPRKIKPESMSAEEFARRSEVSPTTIRYSLIRGDFPLGFAVKCAGGGHAFIIPRGPAEYFLSTGRFLEEKGGEGI